ncbi:VOC family protein [Hoyosella altamirensis]|uniref:Catechol-2,3-dioxygenase n=1 Tax=Hoyosella altamirensis TaxID=616997 RepID=A0A839RK61_9ACTN|nr:VOC family protein [Hoyosella altamirensis]MBB3036564.1 catechol-2,3-dioxygenase [Hoyosella altamirensis]
MSDFPPLGHVALTVKSCDVSRPWYQALLGTQPVIDEDAGPWYHVVWALPGGGLLGIHEHPGTPSDDSFDERRVGLDHVSFHCGSRNELDAWKGKLDEMGVRNGGITDAPYGSGLSFRDPDGNALEFFAAPEN